MNNLLLSIKHRKRINQIIISLFPILAAILDDGHQLVEINLRVSARKRWLGFILVCRGCRRRRNGCILVLLRSSSSSGREHISIINLLLLALLLSLQLGRRPRALLLAFWRAVGGGHSKLVFAAGRFGWICWGWLAFCLSAVVGVWRTGAFCFFFRFRWIF